jgi:phage shock protein PspC (stress-responsive transcriptional regulator)
MNSQTPSPDDEHPAGALPGPDSERPTEPLQSPSAKPSEPAAGPGADPGAGHAAGPDADPGAGPADPTQGYAYRSSSTAPAPSTDFFGWIRSNGIYRGNDRWVGGVCSGIAHRLNVDPVIIRGVFIVLTLLAGIGVFLYGLAWAFLPEPDGRIHVQEAGAGRWSSGMTGSLIATVLGLTGLGGGFWGWSHNGLGGLLWTVFWVAAAIYLVYYLSQRNKSHPTVAAHMAAAPGATYTTGRPGAGYTSTEYTSAFSAGTASGSEAGFPAAPRYGGGPASGTGTGAASSGAGSSGAGGPGSGVPGGNSYPTPWVPPRPQKPRPAGPGAPAVAIATGSALLVGGGLKALDAAHIIDLGGSANAIVWASAAAVLGLGILLAGFRGRTAGILSLFAVIALVTGGIFNTLDDGRMRFQQVDWNPASIEEARGGIDITAGRGTVDLTDLSATAPLTSDVVVPLDITASNVTVVIPQNVPVDIKADMTMGNLNESSGQRGGTTTRESSYNTDKPGNHLLVRIDGTFSNVTIQEGN